MLEMREPSQPEYMYGFAGRHSVCTVKPVDCGIAAPDTVLPDSTSELREYVHKMDRGSVRD